MNVQDHIMLWQFADIQVMDIRRMGLPPDNGPFRYRLPAACFLYAVLGEAQIRLDGELHEAVPYSLLHGSKGTMLDIMPKKRLFEYYLLLYKASVKLPGRADALRPGSRDDPFQARYGFDPRHPLPLLHGVRQMERLWRQPDPLNRLRVRSLFYRFVDELLHQLSEQDAAHIRPDAVMQAVHYLETHYAEAITLDDLARELDYSASHLSALFKSRTGLSPIEFLLRKRMEEAAERLLTTSASIREIAESVGYGDVYYFGRVFKKQLGISPARYRRVHHNRQRSGNHPWTTIRSSIVLGRRDLYIGDESENHYQYKGEENHIMHNYRRNLSLSLVLCLALLLSACGSAANPNSVSSAPPVQSEVPAPAASPTAPAVRTVTDDFGHEITYPAAPERILAPYMEDALVALELLPIAKYAAAGTVQEHLEPWLGDLPTVDMMGGLSPELVLDLEPDLVLISSHFLPADQYDTIAKAAPVYLFEGGSSDWRSNLLKIADLLGKAELATQKMEAYNRMLSEVGEQLKSVAADRTIAIVWPTEKEFYLVGSEFLSGKLIYDELGLTPHALSTGTPDNFAVMSLEKLPELDADDIFVITPEGQTVEQVRDLLDGLPLWSSLPAVQHDRIFHVASGHWINSAYNANLAIIADVTEALLKP